MSVVRALTGLEGHSSGRSSRNMRETIHSGHFMVSDFEPESEAQDEEYEVGMPIPPGPPETVVVKQPETPPVIHQDQPAQQRIVKREWSILSHGHQEDDDGPTAISIDGSLTKLFQCMTLAYRQKLTSPKWNRFKGVRLRWKDKIRLNNVIWRCWHMQFIMKKKTMVCQFASPLDVDGHNKPEVYCQAVVMEGKYWKRKLSTVAAEYKKWRLFYRNRIMGWTHATPTTDLHPVSLDGFDWSRPGPFGTMPNIIFDDDMFMDFTDTLFSSLASNQPFAFPNPREIARAGMVADFIQPGLIQLQPNLDDFMDTLEPLHEYVNSKLLPPVPEELENFEPPDTLLSEDVLPNSKSIAQPFYHQSLLLPTTSASNGVMPNDVRNSSKFRSQQQQQQHENNKVVDVFAKPHGKPRGRSRSGGRHAPTHQQQLVNNANSNTLLSHLLAGSNSLSNNVSVLAPATAGGGVGDYGIRSAPLNMIMSQSDINSASTSYQPSPFHIPPPNTPLVINFVGMGGKAPLLSQMSSGPPGSSAPSNGGSGGGSPTMGHNSPPMGPPSSSNISGPLSPSKSTRKAEGDRGQYKHRRVCHINAEQKRRCNIKNGFDTLHSLIPQLSHNPNAKVSKAAMLAKGAEYIRQLKVERSQLKDEIDAHRGEVEALNASISTCQSMLPATGAPVSRQRTSKMNEMFYAWVRQRTIENWKFWLFSTLIRPLLDSYNNSVSTSSVDEMCRTVLAWVDQHCSLVDLRPAVLTSLRHLCTTTDILSNPANLQEEAYKAVNRPLQHSDRGDRNDPSR